jgi:hypothetical protein
MGVIATPTLFVLAHQSGQVVTLQGAVPYWQLQQVTEELARKLTQPERPTGQR